VDPVAKTITAEFTNDHAANAPLAVTGGFAEGVVPEKWPNGTIRPDGSSGTVLKIVGDINDDGNMAYVEYVCDARETGGWLYRNAMKYDEAAKKAATVEQVLLDDLVPNPDNSPCFTYQDRVVNDHRYVVGVAITLSVRTHDRDPITKQFQKETKALLNVAPRNVFNVWQMASLGFANRVQKLPEATALLLPALTQ